MDIDSEGIEYAVSRTEILRLPERKLATFGTTDIRYYIVTEPSYSEMPGDVAETVIREGRVVAERPRIVTPYYLTRLEGFSPDARRYFELIYRQHGPHAPGLFYTYRNEPKNMNIVSGDMLSVVRRISAEIDRRGDPLTSIIKGEDKLWDVSLMKFIYEMTQNSLQDNLWQLGSRGLLDVDASGVPVDARVKIEDLFRQVWLGELEPQELKEELDRWDLFPEYEDRFLAFFNRWR